MFTSVVFAVQLNAVLYMSSMGISKHCSPTVGRLGVGGGVIGGGVVGGGVVRGGVVDGGVVGGGVVGGEVVDGGEVGVPVGIDVVNI